MSSFLTNNALDLPELATPPAAPEAGRRKLYVGDDGQWYSVGSDGTVVPVGAPGGGGGIQYIALVSQAGDQPPTSIVLRNDLDGLPIWSRDAVGNYFLTFAGAFDQTKTIVRFPMALINGGDLHISVTITVTANYIQFACYDLDVNNAELERDFLPLEVIIYPS